MPLKIIVFTLFVVLLNPIAFASECFSNIPFRRLKIGDINVTIVHDGPVFFNLTTFSVPGAFVSRSYAASFRSTDLPDESVISQNVAVLDLPSARVIVDAGSVDVPQFPVLRETGRLVQNLRAAGIPPETIDGVLLTHGHGDHITGIRTVENQRAFPNAKIYVSNAEHKFWTTVPIQNPKPAIIPDELVGMLQEQYLRSINVYQNRIVLVPDGGSPFPGVKFIPAPGHTAGHVIIRVFSRGESMLCTADTWLSTPDQLENPEWGFFFESDEVQSYETRIRVLSNVARSGELVLSYHEKFPGLGYVTENGASFRWTAAPDEFLGTGVQTKCDARAGK